jgi:hypothetical protein
MGRARMKLATFTIVQQGRFLSDGDAVELVERIGVLRNRFVR